MAQTNDMGWRLTQSYCSLSDYFYSEQAPVPVKAPKLVVVNDTLAETLGLKVSTAPDEELAALFSGNLLPPDSQPISQAYGGHQYGYFTMLGDGRAVLLGEQQTPNNEYYDIQFKGSGQTPYSRQGDGRAALGPMLREYLISEALHALGVPTTRSLAVVTTGEPVLRDTMLSGAILTRVASSHLRVGTFQYAVLSGGAEGVKQLADYAIDRHYPQVKGADYPYRELLKHVIINQAGLIAKWLQVGFVHGVMNTDNMTISGETIDYGPCAFMDAYDPKTVFSSIDHHGRYAYANQPYIAQWNLARLAEALVPVLADTQDKAVAIAEEEVNAYPAIFQREWMKGMRQKLGLFCDEDEDRILIQQWLDWMHQNAIDYTNGFRDLMSDEPAYQDAAFLDWHRRWRTRLDQQDESRDDAFRQMRAVNPVIIPRNHKVEEALVAAEEGDISLFQSLLSALQRPYEDGADKEPYSDPPKPTERVYQTFCGT